MWAYRRPAALASPSQTFDFLASHWKEAKILQSCWCLTLNSSKWKGKGVRTNLIPKYSWNCQNPQLSERNFFKNDDHQPSQQKSTAPTFVEKFPRVFFSKRSFHPSHCGRLHGLRLLCRREVPASPAHWRGVFLPWGVKLDTRTNRSVSSVKFTISTLKDA